jgi:hypothetical protein
VVDLLSYKFIAPRIARALLLTSLYPPLAPAWAHPRVYASTLIATSELHRTKLRPLASHHSCDVAPRPPHVGLLLHDAGLREGTRDRR